MCGVPARDGSTAAACGAPAPRHQHEHKAQDRSNQCDRNRPQHAGVVEGEAGVGQPGGGAASSARRRYRIRATARKVDRVCGLVGTTSTICGMSNCREASSYGSLRCEGGVCLRSEDAMGSPSIPQVEGAAQITRTPDRGLTAAATEAPGDARRWGAKGGESRRLRASKLDAISNTMSSAPATGCSHPGRRPDAVGGVGEVRVVAGRSLRRPPFRLRAEATLPGRDAVPRGWWWRR